MPLRIRYRSGDDQVTERLISALVPEPPNAVSAYCHLREQERTFVLSRIEQALDVETGEVVADIWQYLGMPSLKPPPLRMPVFPREVRSLSADDSKSQRNRDKRELFGRFKLEVVVAAKQAELRRMFGDRCFKCRSPDSLALDHHVPQRYGGRLVPGNVVLLCLNCNAAKHDSLPEHFYSPDELDVLQPVLEAQLQLFDFRFDWSRWNAHPKEYLLSLGVSEADAEATIRSKEQGIEVRLTVSFE